MSKKTRTASLSIFSNSFLIILKVIAGTLSGSVSIISEAIHSFMDLLAAIIAYLSVKVSDKAPDEQHPYGHGKIENISGVIEGFLIFIAAGWIIYEAIHKIRNQNEIEQVGIGFIVMFISSVVNYFVSRRLYKVAKETDSIALEADALHLKVDVYTSLGVALGLALIWITGYHILDPIVAIIVAILILRESFILLKNAYSPLLDVKLPDKEIEIIKDSIEKHSKGLWNFHQLRTRNAGHLKYVDLHLELPADLSVQQAHDICDSIENDIERQIANIEIHIHVEPIS
jgi:cation diffusion facilitator family transporter